MTLALPALGACGADSTEPTPGWKAADLDRNWLDLAVHRGVEDATEPAAGPASADEIVSATGTVRHTVPADGTPEPPEIVLRYPGSDFSYGPGTPDECFRFIVPDGCTTELDEVDCPE